MLFMQVFFVHEPPARVCIETQLPNGMHLRLRLLLRDVKAGHAFASENLRVQSISTWAMACIGPYSQAHRVGTQLFSAGVLGLIPHTMTFPSVAQANKAVIGSDGEAKDDVQKPWQAELWILMRSLRNVLQEMKSSFAEVCLAHIYTTHEHDLEAVKDCVLAYMSRESCTKATPLMVCSVVPKLPKGGQIEINFVCDSESISSQAPATVHVADDASEPVLQGIVVCSSKIASGNSSMHAVEYCANAVSTEVVAVSDEEVDYMACFCTNALRNELEQCRPLPSGLSILVQYTAGIVQHTSVEKSMEAALKALRLEDVCVSGYMPVLFLGEGVRLRIIAMSSR